MADREEQSPAVDDGDIVVTKLDDAQEGESPGSDYNLTNKLLAMARHNSYGN